MLIFLSHAFEGVSSTTIPEGVSVVIYGSKRTSLTPYLAALAVQINYENSHIPLDKRLKYLKIVKQVPHQSMNNYNEKFIDYSRLKTNFPNLFDYSKFIDSKSTYKDGNSNYEYPLVLKPGMRAPNLLFGATGNAGDGATIAVKNLLAEMNCPFPIINMYRKTSSLEQLIKQALDYRSLFKLQEVEVHVMGCRHVTSQHLKNMFGISDIHKSDSSVPNFQVLVNKLSNINSSVPFSMFKTLKDIELNFKQLCMTYNLEINNDNGVTFRFFMKLLAMSLQYLTHICVTGKIYNLNNPEIYEMFMSTIIDLVELIDIFENTIYECDPDLFNDNSPKQFTNTHSKTVAQLMYLRSLCLTYLGDVGFDRKKNEKSLIESPINPNNNIAKKIKTQGEKLQNYNNYDGQLLKNNEVYQAACTILHQECDRLSLEGNDLSFQKSMAILNYKTDFESKSIAKKQTDGEQKAKMLLSYVYPILAKHRSKISLGNTKTLKNVLSAMKRYNILDKHIKKGIIMDSRDDF